jgi:hypothetical protein
MPFKSDKQRKWMHANEPEMAKKWEKEETLREKLRGIIKRELEATTTSAVSPYDTPLAFSKSTQRAIDVDDEDDEKNESISEAPMATRAILKRLGSELNKASETIIKIIDKYKKKADVDGMVKIWMRGLHLRLKKSRIKFESINEKIAKPYSNHLRKAQEEIEYMISNGPTPDGDDGVYDRPNQAMKLLQIAQKSLGKIK